MSTSKSQNLKSKSLIPWKHPRKSQSLSQKKRAALISKCQVLILYDSKNGLAFEGESEAGCHIYLFSSRHASEITSSNIICPRRAQVAIANRWFPDCCPFPIRTVCGFDLLKTMQDDNDPRFKPMIKSSILSISWSFTCLQDIEQVLKKKPNTSIILIFFYSSETTIHWNLWN